jgi:chromosome partitioning protein
MRTIVFASSKGGVGKTSLSAAVGVAAMQAGERVYLIDLDPQGSLLSWGERRQADDPPVDRIDIGSLTDALGGLRSAGYTLAVIDTVGTDTAATAMAMRAADLVLVPARPSALDIQGIKPTLFSLEGVGKPFGMILNACGAGLVSRIEDASHALKLLGVMAPIVCQRVDHMDAMAAGLGVTEYSPYGQAAAEIRAMWKWIKRRMETPNEQAAVA